MELVTKLQIRPEQSLALLDGPADIVSAVRGARADREASGSHSRVAASSDALDADAVIAFVHRRSDLDGTAAREAVAAARDDRLSWLAYPKAGQLGTDLNRDLLCEALAGQAVRPVRQISIDAVWSALRFRPS